MTAQIARAHEGDGDDLCCHCGRSLTFAEIKYYGGGMNACLSPPDARPADSEASREPVAGGAGQAEPRSQGGMRALAESSGEQTAGKAAERIAIRALSDTELAHEAKAMKRKASYAQGMAAKLEREIKRRRRLIREALNEANKGNANA